MLYFNYEGAHFLTHCTTEMLQSYSSNAISRFIAYFTPVHSKSSVKTNRWFSNRLKQLSGPHDNQISYKIWMKSPKCKKLNCIQIWVIVILLTLWNILFPLRNFLWISIMNRHHHDITFLCILIISLNESTQIYYTKITIVHSYHQLEVWRKNSYSSDMEFLFQASSLSAFFLEICIHASSKWNILSTIELSSYS